MKKIKCTMIVLCLAMLMGNQASKADGEVSVGASADIFSKYVWRGQNLVDDWVLQPGASIGYGNLTASVWGNLDLTDENGYGGEFSEIDYTLDYSGQVPDVDVLFSQSLSNMLEDSRLVGQFHEDYVLLFIPVAAVSQGVLGPEIVVRDEPDKAILTTYRTACGEDTQALFGKPLG